MMSATMVWRVWLGVWLVIAISLGALALGVVLTRPAGAQNLNLPTQVYQPLGFAQIAAGGLASAVPLPSIPAGARLAVVCAEAQAIRWRDDGTAPTAAIGMTIPVGTCLSYSGTSLAAIQFIQAVAGGILDVSYYR